MKKKVLYLSLHKFGSNVLEKCLVHGDSQQKEEIINEVVYSKVSEDSCGERTISYSNVMLNDIIKDKYGNYVIQRVLELASEQGRKILIDKITKIGS